MGSLQVRYWQLAALLAVVLPQFDRLPSWLAAGVVLACVWRLPIVEERIPAPGLWLRVVLLVAGLYAVFLSHRTLFGPEGGVSFLILCAALKLLESRNARDVFVLSILDFFILSTAFLFSQSLLLTVYVGLALVVVLSALLVQQQRESVGVRRTLWRAGVLVGQAVPLMLVLFLFFPRLPPIWALNLTQGSGKTGMSDTMSPGDISTLSRSAELAFRVEFNGVPPPTRDMYWRGLVLSRFDGRVWTQSSLVTEYMGMMDWGTWRPAWSVAHEDRTQSSVKYRVTLEATDKPWLFALALPRSMTPKVGLARDFRLLYRTPVYARTVYDVESFPGIPLDVEGLPPVIQQESLELPMSGNEQARAQASRWRNAIDSDVRLVRHVLEWFRKEPFHYTLDPPALGENRIDEFLFKTRRGFCEHYASSFVFLMRAAGIPARVVVGYQGGEKSPLGDYWQIRQLDAHAWAEVWLPGQGWVTVDPTSAVAPDRIEQGAQQMANDPAYWGDSGMSAVRYGNYRVFRELRQIADYVNYRWQKDVLGYDSDSQSSLMQRFLGDGSLLKRLVVMVAILAVMAIGFLLWTLYSGRRHQHPLDKLYLRYCQRLARTGLVRAAGEGPHDFARRVAAERPAEASRAREVALLYASLRYRPEAADTEILTRRLRKLVRSRRP